MANRTQVAGRLASMPAPIVTAVTPGYNGPTVPISYEQANGFQEAVCVPLEDGGVVLDKDNYTQTATLLSGVHGIITNIRTTLATVAVSTYAKKAAIAVTNAICSGTNSVCSAGTTQIASGDRSQCNAGNTQTASGIASQCNAGGAQTASGIASQCNAGGAQTASGDYSQCNAGNTQTASGDYSQCNAGNTQAASGVESQCNAGFNQVVSGVRSQSNAGSYQYNDGDRSAIIGGQYIENIDDDCVAFGVGTSTPPTAETYGDKVTNKNVWAKIHCDTGLIDQKDFTDTSTGTVTTGAGNSIAMVSQPAYTDYADEATIIITLALTPAANSQVIKHGDNAIIDLPAAIGLAGDYKRTIGFVTEKRANPTGVDWGCCIRESAGALQAKIYAASPDLTLDASTDVILMFLTLHRFPTTVSSFSP